MRILLINSFYYPRGGDCVHLLSLEQSLKAAGHEVAVFAMQHPQNQPSPWQAYWPKNVEYGERLGMAASAKAAVRSAYSKDTAHRLLRLLAQFRPDVAHLHSVHHHLTVSVVDGLWRARVAAVWTLHDYRVVCPPPTLSATTYGYSPRISWTRVCVASVSERKGHHGRARCGRDDKP